MKVFVTGASGFIGSELVKDLLAGGHEVRGMARSDEGMAAIQAAGAEAFRGDITDLESLKKGATGVDAVVHLAFNHDFSKFAQNGLDEQEAIKALISALEPGKLIVVTSGVALVVPEAGSVRKESDQPGEGHVPRRPEQTAKAAGAARGVRVAVVRLPQVHDTNKQGLVPYITQAAREKGVSAYVGDGSQRWAAGALKPVAHLYRLAVEQSNSDFTAYHAVSEVGVPMKEIAETIGKGLGVPVKSIQPEEAEAHFGWLARFAGMDMPASSEWTQKTLGWDPTGPGLIEDLSNMKY